MHHFTVLILFHFGFVVFFRLYARPSCEVEHRVAKAILVVDCIRIAHEKLDYPNLVLRSGYQHHFASIFGAYVEPQLLKYAFRLHPRLNIQISRFNLLCRLSQILLVLVSRVHFR